METKTYTTINRAALGWPPGPWDGEPDKVQWPDAATNLPCLAVRHPTSGHWCGYVGVAEGHPMFRKGWDDAYHLGMHGGPTFAKMCQPGESEETGVCHIPGLGEPEHVWWIGFECAHSGDLSPYDAMRAWDRPFGEYRPLAYVQDQCRNLAAQLAINSKEST